MLLKNADLKPFNSKRIIQECKKDNLVICNQIRRIRIYVELFKQTNCKNHQIS